MSIAPRAKNTDSSPARASQGTGPRYTVSQKMWVPKNVNPPMRPTRNAPPARRARSDHEHERGAGDDERPPAQVGERGGVDRRRPGLRRRTRPTVSAPAAWRATADRTVVRSAAVARPVTVHRAQLTLEYATMPRRTASTAACAAGPTVRVAHQRDLIEQVDGLFGDAHEVAGGQLGVAQHRIQRPALRPAVHRHAQRRGRRFAAGQPVLALQVVEAAPQVGGLLERRPEASCSAGDGRSAHRPRGAARRPARRPSRPATRDIQLLPGAAAQALGHQQVAFPVDAPQGAAVRAHDEGAVSRAVR